MAATNCRGGDGEGVPATVVQELRAYIGSDSDSDSEDWMGVLAEAFGCGEACDSDGIGSTAHDAAADCRWAAAAEAATSADLPVATAIPLPNNTDGDGDSARSAVLLRWLSGLPSGAASLDGARVGTGVHGAGLFADRDLPAGHVIARVSEDLILTQLSCERWAAAYHGVGEILAAMTPRPLGDGTWSAKCSRGTSLAVYLIAERALLLREGTSHGVPLATATGGPAGYVASLPGFSTLRTPVPALEQQRQQLTAFASTDDGALLAAAEQRLLGRAQSVEHYVATELQRGQLSLRFPAAVFSTQALRWALGCIYSRAFNIKGKSLSMLPVIDMMNHASSVATGLNVAVDVRGAAMATTIMPVKEGSELRVCYGPDGADMCASFGVR